LEDAVAAAYGQATIDGWARITAAGRKHLQQMNSEAKNAPIDAILVFTDIVRSTELGTSLTAQDLLDFNEEHARLVGQLAQREAGTVREDTGDGFLLTFPDADLDFALLWPYRLALRLSP